MTNKKDIGDGSAYCQHEKIKQTCKDCNFALYLVRSLTMKPMAWSPPDFEKTKASIQYLGVKQSISKNT